MPTDHQEITISNHRLSIVMIAPFSSFQSFIARKSAELTKEVSIYWVLDLFQFEEDSLLTIGSHTSTRQAGPRWP